MSVPPTKVHLVPSLGGGTPTIRISACILARNEAGNIEAAIQSLLGWTDQIIVLDNESTDATAAIAASYGALVVRVTNPRTDGNFDALRNCANDFATGDWIFFLDADERVPPRLGPLLREIVASRGNEFEALVLPFKHFFCGRWMQHCGWWPVYKSAPRIVRGSWYGEEHPATSTSRRPPFRQTGEGYGPPRSLRRASVISCRPGSSSAAR